MSLFTTTVPARHCAVAHRHGVLERVLPAGRHARRLGRRLTVVDLREQLLQVAPQEVASAKLPHPEIGWGAWLRERGERAELFPPHLQSRAPLRHT